mgnify:CR=1 FL=1
MSAEQFTIADGPTADKMIDSFKYSFSPGNRIYVEFRVARRTSGRMRSPSFVVEANVTALKYESGKPGMYIFEANLHSHGIGSIKGFYDATKREGHFEKTA